MNFKAFFQGNILLFLIFIAVSCGQSTDSEKKSASGDVKMQTEVNAPETRPTEEGKKVIVFFGNSITAGYGLDPTEAFPALIQEIIDSTALDYEVINAGLSGETTASGKNRVEWILKQQVDVFVLELGANDGLRGINLEETKRNLQQIIDKVRTKSPDAEIVLAGMQIPPNMGAEYASEFQAIFPELAASNDVHLIPFLLEDVGGERDMNLPDGIHPNAEGHQILAKNVWDILEDIL